MNPKTNERIAELHVEIARLKMKNRELEQELKIKDSIISKQVNMLHNRFGEAFEKLKQENESLIKKVKEYESKIEEIFK